MAEFRSDFLRLLQTRGQLHQVTGEAGLDAALLKSRVTGYIGFDCTGPSLHVGSLVQIMTLRRLQLTGHKPIVVMGGGTTKIGDPSGKDEMRQVLSPEVIESNKQKILGTFARFLTFGDGPSDAIMVDNADWLDQLSYIAFLRDIGRHFSVNRMLTMDSVRLRLDRDAPLSFLEFNYMVLQSYDFVELYRRFGCRLQCGGSDQWGNIVAGIDLGRRVADAELFGVTSPLITTSSGAKMGKTAAGAVWLNPELRSPYDYWQFWRNTEDGDVGRFLRLFTELPEPEIQRLENLQGAEMNEAKKILATEATGLCHGRAAAEEARAAADAAFERGELSIQLPTFDIDQDPQGQWKEGRSNTAIVVASHLVSSSSEARRKIAEGAVRINDRVVRDPNEIVMWTDVDPKLGAFKVQLGKRKIVLVKPKK